MMRMPSGDGAHEANASPHLPLSPPPSPPHHPFPLSPFPFITLPLHASVRSSPSQVTRDTTGAPDDARQLGEQRLRHLL